MKIMLVDDEAVVLEGISRIILQSGKQWQIIAALSSGEAALDAMECLRPEVVISDIRMFKISGIDLARFIQLNYPETLVILLTGHADFEYAQQAISYGVFEYLLKPSRYSEILSCLDRAQKKLTELRLIQNEKQSMVAQMNADITRLREKLLWDLALGLIPISADINTEIERLSLKGAAFGILFCACNSIAGMDIHLQTEKEQETYFLSALRNLFNMSVIPEGPMAASVIMVCDESFAWNLNYIKEKLQEAAASCGDIGKAGISAGCSTITLNAVNLYDCRNEALCAMNKARKLEAEILLYVPHETTYTEQTSQAIFSALRYIDENYRNNLTLSDISKSVFLNPCYLSMLFRKETGSTFTDHVHGRRIQEAKRLLEQTNLKLYEIGYKVGIADQSYFCSLFKRITGMTPTQYRDTGIKS